MAVVAKTDRARVITRDGGRCVTCGTTRDLTMQHRAAVGQGGTAFRVGLAGLLTACMTCNAAYEAGAQKRALVHGWKIRRWVLAEAVPVFFQPFGSWALLGSAGGLTVIDQATAATRMRAAYGPEWSGWVGDLPALPMSLKGASL